MALSTFTTSPNYSSDALFRTDILAIDTAIKALGLTATSDTGQINFSTVTRNVTAYTPSGYAVYQFTDTLAGSYPCLIKVEYGSGASNTALGIWVTVGTTSDGAGNLGAIKTTRIALTNNYNLTGPFASGASGSTSRLTLSLCINAGTYVPQWITIERLQNSSGVDTNTGLVVVYANRTASSGNQVLYYSGAQPPASTMIGTIMANQPAATTWTVGADIGTGPILPLGWGAHPCIQGGLSYFNGDMTAGSTFIISLYGTNKTYMAFGSASIGSLLNLNAAASILTRWD